VSELERRLGEAFDAAARASVDDAAAPPTPRFAAAAPGRRPGRWLAPMAAAAAVVAVVGSVLAVRAGEHHQRTPAAAGAPVRIRLATGDGGTYGVGMPVVAYFSRQFASAKSLSAATTITIDDKQVHGAWYFERSTQRPGYPVEGHLRLRDYWPADARITVQIESRHLSGGPGYTFANAARLTFSTGPRVVAVVDDATHRLSITRDGKPMGSYPVALGAAATPTSRGVKVIMQKDPAVCLRGPGFHECGVRYAEQLTYSGEYLHAAPWNMANIKMGRDTSNGCTNLLPSDAAALYKTLTVGDVVVYPDATGPPMRADAGYGDWNVPWSVWQGGGLIPNS
jgi:lipoprotein-anchoring transpeptidase ErfK/SrfK